MSGKTLSESYQRALHAAMCEEGGRNEEAYKHYLITSTYITHSLQSTAQGVIPDTMSFKLLKIANDCIEGAMRTSKRISVTTESKPVETTPSLVESSSSASSEHPTEETKPTESEPVVDEPTPPTLTPASADNTAGGDFDETDVLALLDSLPDVPHSKSRLKKSATLPSLPKPTPSSKPPPNTFPASTKPRLTAPPPQRQRNTTYFSSPVATNIYGNFRSPIMSSVTPIQDAQRVNTLLADRQSKRKNSDRLALIRTQEINMLIAKDREKTIASKVLLRKKRLEEEAEEEEVNSGAPHSIGHYEAILYWDEQNIRQYVSMIREHDALSPGLVTQDDSLEVKMEKIFRWCFKSNHPISRGLGEAQFNFFSRLNTINKKLSVTSRDIMSVLFREIIEDITLFFCNFADVLCLVYPVYQTDDGRQFIGSRLSESLYKPIYNYLLDVNRYLHEDEINDFAIYLAKSCDNDISCFPEIKEKFYLGAAPYKSAIEEMISFIQTSSPTKKLEILSNLGQEVPVAIKDHYLSTGLTEEEAGDAARIGADDLVPIMVYIISKANIPNLINELYLLDKITPDCDRKGSEGYFLSTTLGTCLSVIQQHQEGPED